MNRPVFLGLCLVLSCVSALPAAAKSVEDELVACRALADQTARTDCYDHLADAVAKARVQAQSAPVPATTNSPQGTVVTAPGPALTQPQPQTSVAQAQPPVQATQAVAAPAPQAQPQELSSLAVTSESVWSRILSGSFGGNTVTIAKVKTTRTGRLRMVMADGVTWDQSDREEIRDWPSVGSQVMISRSTLGYWCRLSKRDLFHCKPRRDPD